MEHVFLMQNLRGMHNVIVPLIEGRKIHYIDVPIYDNVGDILIFKGAKSFLLRNNISCEIYASFENYNIDWAEEADCLLLQGGGNMGDLYPEPQRTRHSLIERYRDKRIVILPQTIYFQNEDKLNDFKRVCQLHKDLHICVRDTQSYETALSFTKNVYLLPDMAHSLYPFDFRRKRKKESVLNFMRTDNEAKSKREDGVDWEDILGFDKNLIRIIAISFKYTSKMFNSKLLVKIQFLLWQSYSDYIIKKSVKKFLRYDLVKTDRLHGHILSALLDVPCKIYDNSYGKNFSYAKAWTLESDIIEVECNE
jgi:pyruvyl transferase EpsO